jgi:cardiolipin synthase A/B
VDSHDFGVQVSEMLDTDLRGARRVVLHEHENRGWPLRLLERLASPVSWFL